MPSWEAWVGRPRGSMKRAGGVQGLKEKVA